MRRIAILATAALLLGSALPAGAEGDVCLIGTGDRLVELGSSTGTIATPARPLYLDTTVKNLVLSLPQDTPEFDAPALADLEITLSWDGPASDFDMDATGPDGATQTSNKINPLDGGGETVTVAGVAHCDSVNVAVSNFAGNPLDTLTLTVVATDV